MPISNAQPSQVTKLTSPNPLAKIRRFDPATGKLSHSSSNLVAGEYSIQSLVGVDGLCQFIATLTPCDTITIGTPRCPSPAGVVRTLAAIGQMVHGAPAPGQKGATDADGRAALEPTGFVSGNTIARCLASFEFKPQPGFFTFDLDELPDHITSLSQLDAIVAERWLPWAGVRRAWALSSGACMTVGGDVMSNPKAHGFCEVDDASMIPSIARAAAQALGGVLTIDLKIYSPERVFYVGPGVYEPPLVGADRSPQLFGEGRFMDLSGVPRYEKPQRILATALAPIEMRDWERAEQRERYEAILATHVARLHSAVEGQRDRTSGAACAAVSKFVGAGVATEQEAVTALLTALDGSGYTEAEFSHDWDTALASIGEEDPRNSGGVDAAFGGEAPEPPARQAARPVATPEATGIFAPIGRVDGWPVVSAATGSSNTAALRNIDHAFETGNIRFSFDVFTHAQFVIRDGARLKLDDNAYLRLWHMVQSAGLVAAKTTVFDAIDAAAARDTHDSAVDFFNALPTWDGVVRAEDIFITQLGAADTSYTRKVSRLFWAALVRRGCGRSFKFDYLPILRGPQNRGKSTLLRLIIGDEFYEENLSLHNTAKEIIELTTGKLIAEIGEMQGMKKTEREHVKAFVSRTTDTARGAYGRKPTERQRRFTCLGTANPEGRVVNLKEEDRRFPFIEVSKKFDPDWAIEHRLQILAEAVAIEVNYGKFLTLDDEAEAEATTIRAEIASPDFTQVSLQKLFDGVETGKIEQNEVWALIGMRTLGDIGTYCAKNQGGITPFMEKMGWRATRLRRGKNLPLAFTRGDKPKWLTVRWTGQHAGIGIGSICTEDGDPEPAEDGGERPTPGLPLIH